MNLRSPSLSPLRHPGFRLLFSSSFFWYFGRWMDALLASWLALQLTDSAWYVALVGFYRNLPVLLFGPFAGAIADRVDRRALLVGSGLTNAGASFAIGLLMLAGRLEYWHLAIANVVLGFAWAVEFPTRRAALPDVARKDLLLPAMVLDTVSMNVSRVGGPLLGGTVLALLDVPSSYVLLSLVYLSATLPLLFLRLPRRLASHSVSALRFLGEGIRFCLGSAPVRGVLIITFVMNALAFPFIQLLSVFARDILKVGPFELGLLTSGDGIGSLIGAGLLAAMGFRRFGLVFVVASIVMCTALVAFSASPVFLTSFAMLVLAGIGHAGFTALQGTITLTIAGDEMRGRVMGVVTLAIGSATFGMLLTGALASVVGAPWALGLSCATSAILIVAVAATTPGLLAYAPGARRPVPGHPSRATS